jgi:hypothetical protein
MAAGKELNICSNYYITDDERIRPENSEVFRLWGDNALIRELTGWQPVHDIRKGLEITCDWFAKPGNMAKYKTGIYNL